MPQLLKPVCLEPVLHNKRSHCSEKPVNRNKEWCPFTTTGESLSTAIKTQCNQNQKIIIRKVLGTIQSVQCCCCMQKGQGWTREKDQTLDGSEMAA